jgi:hypothetical protein
MESRTFGSLIAAVVAIWLPLAADAGIVSCIDGNGVDRANGGTADMTYVPTTCLIDGALGSSASVGIFNNEQDLVSGTGFRNSFLRIDAKGNNNKESFGYNTDERPIQDGFYSTPGGSRGDPNFTRSVPIDDLVVFTKNGVDYFKLLLDINEPKADPKNLLSLNEMQIFMGDTANMNWYDDNGNNPPTLVQYGYDSNGDPVTTAGTELGTAELVWNMDEGNEKPQDMVIELDYSNYPGSGREDLTALIPTSVFDGRGTDQKYMYLYSNFGRPNTEDAGFEEWAYIGKEERGDFGDFPTSVVPEPGTLLLLGTGLIGIGGVARRRGEQKSG